jgi:hypothetical protein
MQCIPNYPVCGLSVGLFWCNHMEHLLCSFRPSIHPSDAWDNYKTTRWGLKFDSGEFYEELSYNFYDRYCPQPLHSITILKLELNAIKCNNDFNNKIKHLHVLANDGHHQKGTNSISFEIVVPFQWWASLAEKCKGFILLLKSLLHLMEFNSNFIYINCHIILIFILTGQFWQQFYTKTKIAIEILNTMPLSCKLAVPLPMT